VCVELDSDLELEVEFETRGDDGVGERRVAPVRLLRSQRLPGGRTVLALEFLTP
jgi:hypothetical protein